MGEFRLDRLLEYLTRSETQMGVLWFGLAFLTITMLVMTRSRLGQSKALRKCIVLSVLAHILLAGYATTVQIVASTTEETDQPMIKVSLSEDPIEAETSEQPAFADEKPWESLLDESPVHPEPLELARADPVELPELERLTRNEQVAVENDPSIERVPLIEPAEPEPDALPIAEKIQRTATKSTERINAPSAQRRQAIRVKIPVQPDIARRVEPDSMQRAPRRHRHTGVSSALLNQPMPIPRMTGSPETPVPAESLAGMANQLPTSSSGRPARWSMSRQPRDTESVSPVASDQLQPTRTERITIRPPSLATRADAGKPVAKTTDSEEYAMASIRPVMPSRRQAKIDQTVPSTYKLRTAPNRSQLAEQLGATAETEEAVHLALRWLAESQSSDGRWDASLYGSGHEQKIAERDRENAGSKADTGVTGLALMAFLAAGNTHKTGLYRENVRRGLNYLIQKQTNDGSLSGDATKFAARYCHAMAAIALCEDYGMTGESKLEPSVQRAVAYTLAAQNKSTGGWRYTHGDEGDTSQLGWQLMVLKSASTAGVPIPSTARTGMSRFLRSVSYGKQGGLAAYRPGEQVSRAMTAEALACRQFLGQTEVDATAREAGDYLLRELPGKGQPDFYYWYYGTLAMNGLRGEYWEHWNTALRTELLKRQRTSGSMKGSWASNTRWGGYGGEIYSTALATLCLEVYYRFLPTYMQSSKDVSRQ